MVPLTTDPNHRFRCMIPIDSGNRFLNFFLHYNHAAECWSMDISDDDDNALVTSLPLVTGEYPAANLLEQYAFLGIGAAVIVPIGIAEGEPDADNLGSAFVMVWSDTQ